MKAKSCLRVSVLPSGNSPTVSVVLTASHLEPSGRATINFVGASCPASVQSGSCDNSSITFVMTKGKPGIIALHMNLHHPKWPDQSFSVIIPIGWDSGKVLVDLDEPFVSPPDRVGQITQYSSVVVPNHDLRVTAGGKKFSTCSMYYGDAGLTAEKMQKLQAEGYAIVSDAELLCRFLVDEATLEEVEKAVTAEPVNVTALIKENARLTELIRTTDEGLKRLQGRLESFNGMYQQAQGNLEALQSEHRKLQENHSRVCAEHRQDQAVLTSQAKELSALNRARLRDLQTILSLIANDGERGFKVRFGGLPWVAIKRVKVFAATVYRGLELEVSDRPDHDMA